MRKSFRNLATIVIMGVPCWVVILAIAQEDPTTLVVRVEEPEVRIEVGGRAYNTRTGELGPVEIEPGEHVLNVWREDEILYSRPIRVARGERNVVNARWNITPNDHDRELGSAAKAGSLSDTTLALQGSLDLSGHLDSVTGVSFRGENQAVSVGEDRTLRFWDLDGGSAPTTIESATLQIRGMLVLDKGRKVATLSENGDLEILEVVTGKNLKSVRSWETGKAVSLAASPDGQQLAMGSDTGAVRLVDSESGVVRKLLDLSPIAIGSLAFSPDGKTLLVGLVASPLHRNDILVYDLKADKILRKLVGSRAPVWGLCYLPDGRRAVSVGGDKTLRLWDVELGRELKRYPSRAGVGRCVAVSPDGRYAVTGTGYNWTFDGGWKEAASYGVTVWDLVEDRVVGHYATSKPIRCLALSQDGRRALAGGEDRIVHAIDLPDAKAQNTAISTTVRKADQKEGEHVFKPQPTIMDTLVGT